MLTREKIIQKLREELPFLKKEFGVKSIGIFGSYTKGTQSKDSDIDLIIEFEKPIGLAFMDLASYVEELLGKKVDILTPEGIKSIRVNKIAKDIKKSVIYV
ncbi:MAG: nucleotidyltransferase [Promethearchaeota archaeon]|nr:MAG: nucleotidyltransferase [Candidatus Lokiarchaeota archaeon]